MIIGISGKKQHGKDTIANIIQYLFFDKRYPGHSHDLTSFSAEREGWKYLESTWERKKFADKLKAIVCILIGCTMEQLEDNKFKETPLGEQWKIWYWQYKLHLKKQGQRVGKIFASEDEAIKGTSVNDAFLSVAEVVSEILTPRKLLQLVGTEGGRELLHPNLWINALLKDYTPYTQEYIGHGDHVVNEVNWIVTDVRFPNEAKAIQDRDGILIRVNRNKRTSDRWQEMFPAVKVLDPDGWDRRPEHYQYSWFEQYITLDQYKDKVSASTCHFDYSTLSDQDKHLPYYLKFEKLFTLDEHESETALDNYPYFDAVLSNDGPSADLSKEVQQALISLNVLT